MRALNLIPPIALTIALAACSGENQGWNPNYRAEATPYGDYLRARESALTGKIAEPPRGIPIALPAKAPTGAELAGPTPVQIIERETTIAAGAVGITSNRRLPDRARAPAFDVPPPVVYPVRRAAPAAVVVGATPQTVVVTPAGRYARDGSVRPGNCAAWPSPEAAQRAFLAQGGPQRDPLGLDPDGDGRVCGWTPSRGEPL